MRSRCYNPKETYYINYGGRGISICDEWMDFSKFLNWALANGHKTTLSIDRINNNGNYEPSNCRWATREQQANNTRSNKFYTFNGETGTAKFFSTKYNKTYANVTHRLRAGYPIEAALFSSPQTGPKTKDKLFKGASTRRVKNPEIFCPLLY